jgi:hypothetical protein
MHDAVLLRKSVLRVSPAEGRPMSEQRVVYRYWDLDDTEPDEMENLEPYQAQGPETTDIKGQHLPTQHVGIEGENK